MNKKVIVIGGGIAGLAAAAELLRHDCEVKLLEAKERLGVRIHTVSGGRSPIELGAEFMHGQSAACALRSRRPVFLHTRFP
jgi:polyamine oxidase